MSPQEREEAINALGAAIEASSDRDVQRTLFREMAELIRGRSAEVVAQIERKRGLLLDCAASGGMR
ncbi:hypothetical protein [Cupriavidus metallidurans]|uniref:hypothetical protein n=1 Tax=Cupriavidus metallidurans TaxID=119219 RepID=UPI0005680DEF|nr:hypothetical protein [Cupriavidus metallidurans]